MAFVERESMRHLRPAVRPFQYPSIWGRDAATRYLDPNPGTVTNQGAATLRIILIIERCHMEFVMTDKPVLTTTAGNPLADNQNSMTAGPRGPVLMRIINSSRS